MDKGELLHLSIYIVALPPPTPAKEQKLSEGRAFVLFIAVFPVSGTGSGT